MACDGNGRLIDPYGGRKDLESKKLRHVSDAFAEDPLRVFRVARFAASFPDFSVAEETSDLMREMQPELVELSPERVWIEYEKGMSSLTPFRFFEVLNEAQCVEPWFEDVNVFGLIALLKERWLRELNAIAALVGSRMKQALCVNSRNSRLQGNSFAWLEASLPSVTN